MTSNTLTAMRDLVLPHVLEAMRKDPTTYFLSNDMGAPVIDVMRQEMPQRFINVGIAEQNLINIAAGLSIEGMTVFTYGIASFYLRAYEMIRTNLSMLSGIQPMRVTMIGIGAGASYEIAGPTHHAFEDLGAMRLLPNISVYCPSDSIQAKALTSQIIAPINPTYLRLDGKAGSNVYDDNTVFDMDLGFHTLLTGHDIWICTTGSILHEAKIAVEKLSQEDIHVGLIDFYRLSSPKTEKLRNVLSEANVIFVVQEAFSWRGGLDSFLRETLSDYQSPPQIIPCSFGHRYFMDSMSRMELLVHNGCDADGIAKRIRSFVCTS